MSSALNTFSDRMARRRVAPAGSSRLLSMSSWSSFDSLFSAYNMGQRTPWGRESKGHGRHIHKRKEEASRCGYLSALACQPYRRLISSSHDEEADFEVAFSLRAGVIRVIQQEPLPHDTVGWNGTCIKCMKIQRVYLYIYHIAYRQMGSENPLEARLPSQRERFYLIYMRHNQINFKPTHQKQQSTSVPQYFYVQWHSSMNEWMNNALYPLR